MTPHTLRRLATAIFLTTAFSSHAQNINPNTQINWPLATGSGNPAPSACTKNGLMYVDISTNPYTQWTCGPLGWTKPSGTGGGGTVNSFSAPTANWPTWLVPSVANSTTNPVLSATSATLAANLFLASPNGSSGALTARAIAAADLPIGTTSQRGALMPDGTTITVNPANGQISAPSAGMTWPGGSGPAIPCYSGSSSWCTSYSGSNTVPFTFLPLATNSQAGIMRPDGTSCTVTAGVLTCPGGGGGPVSSVANSDGTLNISPNTGAVTASLNLGHANTWSALQTFNAGVNASGLGISGSGVAGYTDWQQGTLPGTQLPNSIRFYAPASVLASYAEAWPSTPPSGTNTIMSCISGGCSWASNTPISGLTTNTIPKASSPTGITDSLLDDGKTTANVLTYIGANGFALSPGGSHDADIRFFPGGGDIWNFFVNGSGGGKPNWIGFYDQTAGAEVFASTVTGGHEFNIAASTGAWCWNNQTAFPDGSPADTCWSRDSAGVIDAGNGTIGDHSGTVKMASFDAYGASNIMGRFGPQAPWTTALHIQYTAPSGTLGDLFTFTKGSGVSDAVNLTSQAALTLTSAAGVGGSMGDVNVPTDFSWDGTGHAIITHLITNSSSNTDLNGEITLASGTGTYGFSNIGNLSHPICTANDTTALQPVQITYSGGGGSAWVMTLHGTGSDVIDYMCTGRN